MQTNKNVKFVFMTIEEVKNECKFFNENRNHYLSFKEANEHFFSNSSTKKTIKRIRQYQKDIFDKVGEWKICTPMIVYDVEGTKYIVDGQGRFMALSDDSKNYDILIPVMLVEGKTYMEMIEDAIAMNTRQKKWTPSDMYRTHLLMNGKPEEAEQFLKLQTKYENELDVTDYVSRLILLGYANASHNDNIHSTTTLNPYHEVIFNCFKLFYEKACASCGTNKNDIKSIKRQNVSQAFNSIITEIIRECEKDGIDYTEKVYNVSSFLSNEIAKLDRIFSFKQTFGNTTSKAIRAYFVKWLSKGINDRYVKSMFKYEARMVA